MSFWDPLNAVPLEKARRRVLQLTDPTLYLEQCNTFMPKFVSGRQVFPLSRTQLDCTKTPIHRIAQACTARSLMSQGVRR